MLATQHVDGKASVVLEDSSVVGDGEGSGVSGSMIWALREKKGGKVEEGRKGRAGRANWIDGVADRIYTE